MKCAPPISKTHDFTHFHSITSLSGRWCVAGINNDGEWTYYGAARDNDDREMLRDSASSALEKMPGGWIVWWVRRVPK